MNEGSFKGLKRLFHSLLALKPKRRFLLDGKDLAARIESSTFNLASAAPTARWA
jgi:hypothetical protein